MSYLCLKEIPSSMLTQLLFQNQLQKLIKKPEKKTFLLAVSGGADSMVLAHCFKDLDIHFRLPTSIINFVEKIQIWIRKQWRIFVRETILNFIYTKFQKKIRSRNILSSFGLENCGMNFSEMFKEKKIWNF